VTGPVCPVCGQVAQTISRMSTTHGVLSVSRHTDGSECRSVINRPRIETGGNEEPEEEEE